jgi:hypothetical protein
MHRKFEESPVTEDDINEVKGEISTMRYEMLAVFEKNGMDVSCANRKEKSEFGALCANFRANAMNFLSSSRVSEANEGLGTTLDEGFPRCAC